MDEIKIKQSCLENTRWNKNDQIKNINNELHKTLAVVGFLFTILAISGESFSDTEFCYKLILGILILPILFFSYENLKSHQLVCHLGVKDIFDNSDGKKFEKYIDTIFKAEEQAYENITKHLEKKSENNRYLYFLTILVTIYILFFLIF